MSAVAGMNVYAIGASRNIGYHASLRLLRKGATVTFLLRRISCFDDDAEMQAYIASGRVRLVHGDAHMIEDVRKGWETARSGERNVDLLLFTLGGVPNLNPAKGPILSSPDICTRALLNTLRTIPDVQRTTASQPRIITISSTGITPASHAHLPLMLKPLYGIVLAGPHADKLGLEAVMAHCAGWDWDPAVIPEAKVLPLDWAEVEGTPRKGELKKVLVVRPALLSDGKCKGDQRKDPYRVGEQDLGRYYVSRKDVAHFIVERALEEWGQWEGKGANIAY